MDIAQVENDLAIRIDQAKCWLLSESESLTGFYFRNHTWTASPIDFLDDEKRVEKHGVAFLFSLDDQSKNISVQLNVRVKPLATVHEKGDSPPYIVVYLVNQQTGKEESVCWNHIEVADSYRDLLDISIQSWFEKWIQHALASDGARKILKPEMRLQ
jgi:hypothetical protein